MKSESEIHHNDGSKFSRKGNIQLNLKYISGALLIVFFLSLGFLGDTAAVEVINWRSYEEGLVSYQAVLEVQAKLAEARARHIEAEESLASGLETLSFYTGLKAGEIEPVSSFRKEPPAYNYEKLKEEALDLSIEREILLAKAKMAETDLGP